MSILKNAIESYQSSIDKIFKSFGIENGYGEIDIKLHVKWSLSDYDVRWLERDNIYSNEMISDPMYFENYMMVYIDNSCGDNFYQIFDTNLKDDDIQEDFGK